MALRSLRWLALNWLLFVPVWFCAQPSADFWPFFPEAHKYGPYGLDTYSIHQYVLWLFVRRDNLDIFRVSIDFLALLLIALWTAPFVRAQRPVRVALVTVYSFLFVFLFYDQAVATFLARVPALGEDWRLALNLGHLLGSFSFGRRLLIFSSVILLITGLSSAMNRSLILLQRWSAELTAARRWQLTAACVVASGACLGWFGVKSDAPTLQLLSKHMAYNARASYFEALRLSEVRHSPPDRSYDNFSQVVLARKPNVYLLMIEAYGEVLANWDLAPSYRKLMARVEQRLSAAGYHSRTAYSVAPVHGGTSWFSISTVHTGMRIDRPTAYDAFLLVGTRIPSLTRFFNEQGYATYALQPGNHERTGLHRFDTVNHRVSIDLGRLRYHGPRYGWGIAPDQYSIGRMRERYLSKAPDPHYLYYMAVSTHWSWDGVPPYVRDWHSLNGDFEPAPEDASWPPIREMGAIHSELRRNYFRSIDYEFRLLTEWLESEPAKDSIVIIMGDHQPRLETDVPGGINLRTPVHMLSRDPAFVDSFADVGFQPGMYAEPARPSTLRHEGLLSLWISKLRAAYGTPQSPSIQYRPVGIALSGLNR